MTQQEDGPSIRALVALEHATRRLEREHGRKPTIDELAAAMKLSSREVRQLVEAAEGTVTIRPKERPRSS